MSTLPHTSATGQPLTVGQRVTHSRYGQTKQMVHTLLKDGYVALADHMLNPVKASECVEAQETKTPPNPNGPSPG